METLLYSQQKLSREELFIGVGASVLIHALVFTLTLVGPWALPRKPVKPPFYTVNLVSIEDVGGPSAMPGKAAVSKNTETAPRRSEAQKPSASASAKSAPVVPLKRLRMEDPIPKQDNELKRLDAPEPKLSEKPQSPVSVEKSLDTMIAKPKTPPKPTPIQQESGKDAKQDSPGTPSKPQEKPSKSTTAPSSVEGNAKGASEASARPGTQGSGGGSPDGSQITSARLSYYRSIQNAIKQQYILPPSLKDQELQATVVLVVRRDGRILDLRIEKPSGNSLFDESIMRAVRRSDPLPPFPEVYSPSQEEMALRFRPQDLS